MLTVWQAFGDVGGPNGVRVNRRLCAGSPVLAQVTRRDVAGTAVGAGAEIVNNAYHEFNERAWFKIGPRAASRCTLRESRDQAFAGALTEMLVQTARPAGLSMIETTNFDMVTAVELTTGRLVDVPIGLIGLGHFGEFHEMVPISDSTGSAGHETPELCLQAALLEFVERQGFLAAWFAASHRSIVTLSERPRLFARDVENAIETMMRCGVVHLCDISMGWPHHAFVAVFEARH